MTPYIKMTFSHSKEFGDLQNFLFPILKVLFLMKQVKYHDVFIYYTKYKYSSVTLTVVLSDNFWKIDLAAFYFFSSSRP